MIAQKLIEEIAAKHKLTISKIKEGVDVKKEGFLGNISKVKVMGKDDGGEEQELSLVLKAATKNNIVRDSCLIQKLFEREIIMYTSVLPAMRQFQEKRNLNPFSFAPKYFLHSLEDNEEILIMQDLSEEGFQLHDKRIPMDENHVQLVMETYGKFHAITYAMRDQEPEIFQGIEKRLDNIYADHIAKNNIEITLSALLKEATVVFNRKEDEKYLEVFSKYCDTIEEEFKRMVNEQVNYSVVLHADCWTNNMMFKYGDASGGEPTEIRFIDFQFSRIGNPALDLVFYVYSCANERALNHIEDYLKLYYRSLCTTLEILGSNPQLIPYEEIENYWKKSVSYGLALSSLLLYLSIAKPEELIDMNEASEKDIQNACIKLDFADKDIYLDRMRINIQQCVDKNYI